MSYLECTRCFATRIRISMNRTNITRIALPCWLALLSATAQAQADVAKALQDTLPRGWECMQGPNDLDHPGRAFYVDRRGVRYELADLGTAIRAETGELSSVVVSTSGYLSAGLFAKMVGLGSLSASGSKSYATKVSLSQRQEIRTNEANSRAALRTLDPTLLDAENTYYIIRNTQIAKQMRLTVDKSIAGAFGGEAQFNKAVGVGGAAKAAPAASSVLMPTNTIISAQEGGNYTIDQNFPKPMTVCFLAQRFTLKNVTGGVGGTVRDAQLLNQFWAPSTKPARKLK
jgi:hypothetical protein